MSRSYRTAAFGLTAIFFATVPGSAGASPLRAQLPVVGEGQPYELIPDLGRAVVGDSGRSLWSETIAIDEASFLKAHFADVDLQPGDVLRVRSRSGWVVEEIRGRGPKEMITFWGLSAKGDLLGLELDFAGVYDKLPFRIDKVIVGNRDLFAPRQPPPGDPESICAPADFEDVICYQGDAVKWANVQGSVGVMSVGGDPDFALFCSGSNLSAANRVLTNDHCVGSQPECDNAEFVFNHYRTGCNDGSPPTDDWQTFRCDEYLAGSPVGSCDAGLNDLDFGLFSVLGDPGATFGWVEPDPVPITDGEAVYIIQHPGGRPHEITHGSGANVDVDGTVLRYYDTLDTEGGSSGSPIFREAGGKLIGLHHCGGCSTPGVGNRGMLMSDIYPLIESFIVPPAEIFADGFESGDTSAWAGTAP